MAGGGRAAQPGRLADGGAKRRAIDLVRRHTYARKLADLGHALAEVPPVEPALASYHLLPGVRGDLLARLGRTAEARAEFARAASLTRNARDRDLLLRRAADPAAR